MKYPQHILASDNVWLKEKLAALLHSPEGKHFNPENINGLVPAKREDAMQILRDTLFIGRREELEVNEAYRQWVPYYVFWRAGANGIEVFVYQRSEKQGEGRLLRKHSVGLGGHMDIVDVCHNDSVIDVAMTLAHSGYRELSEEVTVVSQNVKQSWQDYTTANRVRPKFVGFILDESDAVGRVHCGLLFTVELPGNVTLSCKGDDNKTVGFMNQSLLRDCDLENWSNIVHLNLHTFGRESIAS